MASRLSSVAIALVMASSLVLALALPALAGTRMGSVTCGGTRTAIIQSQASVNVYHNWKNGNWEYFYNPYRLLKTSFTSYQSTWWVVDYDFEVTSAGASCTQ